MDTNSTYQIYDFIKDVDFHIVKKIPILLYKKSEAFKEYLFNLKMFNVFEKLKTNDPIFNEKYFIVTIYGTTYLAKRLNSNEPKFEYVEIVDGLKHIRKNKIKKLFK